MRKVCVITTTRAEYGLLRPLLFKIKESQKLELNLIVSGTHLLTQYGNTENEIIKDGFNDYYRIHVFDDIIEGENNISIIMSNVLRKTSDYLKTNTPEVAVVYGDRYEMLAFAIAFANARIPLIHICGGERTEGLLDEAYRHSITKMSTLHFTNCEEHRKRVIQLGENPNRVFNVGDTSVDNIFSVPFIPDNEIRNIVKASPYDKINIVTFHPVTLVGDTFFELENMLSVIDQHKEYYYVFTKANADYEGNEINTRIREFVDDHNNSIFLDSLGVVKYLSLMRISECVIGNSSSGLTEAPLFHIPTINIGERQKNRAHGDTVIDCSGTRNSISASFDMAFSDDFRRKCKTEESLFGDGHAAEKMIEIMENELEKGISIVKEFYDINFEERL